MQIYLPIADLSVNALAMIAMGAAVGFLSGIFGVGGGFLMTPLLIFSGVPTAVAVATGANPIIASSITGTIAQYKRKNVDIKLGGLLLAGGAAGSLIGVFAIHLLRKAGQVDFFVTVLYVIFMSVIGVLMLAESALRLIPRGRPVAASSRRLPHRGWIHRLPFKTRLRVSKLYISAIPPITLGLIVGFLSGLMGVGGGFVIVPGLIYLLRVPTNVAIGTSLFQVIFVSAVTTILQAALNRTVDIALALLLMAGGVAGAHVGAVAGGSLKAEQIRLLLALLVLAVGLRLGVQLVLPGDLYSVTSGAA